MPATSSSGALSADVSLADASLAMAGHHMLVAEIGAFDFLVTADHGGHVRSNHASVDQHRDAVCEREYRIHVVLDQHDRDFLPQIGKQSHHARGFSGAKPGHG